MKKVKNIKKKDNFSNIISKYQILCEEQDSCWNTEKRENIFVLLILSLIKYFPGKDIEFVEHFIQIDNEGNHF